MSAAGALAAPPHRLRRDILFADVQHGLCNRLRALASAAVIAAASDRQLVVIWRADDHCRAEAADLFRLPWPVIADATAETARARAVLSYNYMEIEPGAAHGQPVLAGSVPPRGDVYVRSAYSLVSPLTEVAAENLVLRRLQPAPEVLDLLAGQPRAFDVAVHVRMATGPAFDHLAHESPAHWPAERHRELTEWRLKSDVARFVAALDRLVAAENPQRIFVAADLAASYAALSARFGGRIHHLPRDLYDRSARQMQYALADLMLLTAAPLFLSSTWSSFSEVAQRLARPGRREWKSGLDF